MGKEIIVTSLEEMCDLMCGEPEPEEEGDGMTREEAIVNLKMIGVAFVEPVTKEQRKLIDDTFEMAIQALSQKPCEDAISTKDAVSRGVFEQVMCERDIAIEQLHELGYEFGQKIEPCEDAISREAVCNIVNDIRDCISVEGYWGILERLKKLPSVTRQTGEWIDDEFGSKCSCCGIHTHLDKFDRPMKFKYCSMCGADMRGAE